MLATWFKDGGEGAYGKAEIRNPEPEPKTETVYGLAKIQRDSKYPIACAPFYYFSNFLSAQNFYLQSNDHF